MFRSEAKMIMLRMIIFAISLRSLGRATVGEMQNRVASQRRGDGSMVPRVCSEKTSLSIVLPVVGMIRTDPACRPDSVSMMQYVGPSGSY